MSESKYNYETGERVPEGTYICMNCTGNNPETVIMPDMSDVGKLPECEKCGHTLWYKV